MPIPLSRRRLTLPLLAVALAGVTALRAAETPAPASSADPTAAIIAQGQQIYRQRDIDALVLVASRYHHGSFAPADEDQLRHALARILPAREPLLEALAGLPPSLGHGKLADAYVLDLLDYQAENAPAPAAAAVQTPGSPAAAAPLAAPAAPADGPVVITLPPLVIHRTLPGATKRQLSLQIALRFADQATSHRFEAQAAVIRDAILGYLDAAPDDLFLEPRQAALKQGLSGAITAQLADFPAAAVLIPQLDAGPADAEGAAHAQPGAPAAAGGSAPAPRAAPGAIAPAAPSAGGAAHAGSP